MTAQDVFSTELIKSALDSIANEMFWVTVRTAKSPLIYEVYDFSTGLTNEDGDTVAISLTVPVWAGVHKFMATSMVKDLMEAGEEIAAGDVIASNDPYATGTHLNDIGLALPIFYKDDIVAIATAKGHINDIGGMNPGSYGPSTTEIFQEGLFIPPVRYYRKGKQNEDVIRIILGNSRMPDFARGDLEALAASLRLADRRIKDLIGKYSVETVRDTMKSMVEGGAKLAASQLRSLPKGKFYAEDFMDEGYLTMDPPRITASLEITDKEFVVDFTDNPEAFPVSANTTYPATVASVDVVFLSITNPHEPFNQGLLRPVKVICPEGTIFSARRPSPVSVYWETMTYASDLVWKALAPHIPDKLSAGHFLSICCDQIAGIDPRNREYFIINEPNPGGWGAQMDKDGESALISVADGETYTTPVEVSEIRFPVLVEKHVLNIEGGTGHGKHRGGFGIVKEYSLLADKAAFTTAINRMRVPPWGVAGGQKGTTNIMVITRDGKEILRTGKANNFELKRGDIVSIRSGGGGGWGDPLERDPELVSNDVRNGFITAKEALDLYKVVLDPHMASVDWSATDDLRMKAQ